jgi:low temperature requirement protein LtrA
VLHGDTLAVALLGAGLGFLYWVGYFQRARGNAERHVSDEAAGRNLRLWAYGHIPLYLGIAGLGAGTVYLAHHTQLAGAAPWVFALGAALSMAGVTLVSLATYGRPIGTGWPFFLIAATAAATPAAAATAPVLLGAIAALAAGQIALSLLLNRKTLRQP